MIDFQSALIRNAHQENEALAQQIQTLEHLLVKQSAIFRQTLPDLIRDIYDHHTARTISSEFSPALDQAVGISQHLNYLLQLLENQIQWFDANSADLPERYELGILLGTKHLARRFGNIEEEKEWLAKVQRLAERFYETAIGSIQKQWAEARRAGKQEELIERWKRQMRQSRLADSGSGTGPTQSNVEEQESTVRPVRSPSSRTPTAAKTWVEFQLVDEDGEPVPNVAYKVKLPDGSTRRGNLDSQGLARFDNIDPGQCQITFPEIDAREWQPA